MRANLKEKIGTILFLVFLLGISQSARAQLWADLVLYDGKILTADHPNPDRFTIAEAVAVFGDRIVGVGSSQEMLKMAGPQTRRLDLEGKTVIPGRINTHTHIQNHGARTYLGYASGGVQLRSNMGMTDAIMWTNKEEGLAQLRTIALGKKPGEWAVVQPTFTENSGVPNILAGFPPQFYESITLADLDRVAPNIPLNLSGYAYTEGLLNSKALELLLQRFPGVAGVQRDSSGKPTGRILGTAQRTVALTFWPDDDVAWMAEGYRKIMQHSGFMGVTTVVTRMERDPLRAFQYLDSRGEMSVRLAYASESLVDHADAEAFIRRYDTPVGAGTPYLWNIGFSLVNIDLVASSGGACYSKPYPRESRDFPLWRYQFYGPYGDCPLTSENHTHRQMMEAVIKNGGRIAGAHLEGDRAFDEFFDIIEPLAAQYPVREQRIALDHCRGIRPDQIQRAAKFDIAFSCNAPPLGGESSRLTAPQILFGREVGAEMMTPFQSMIDAGLRPSLEHDSANTYSFYSTEQIITRKRPDGTVFGPGQRVNRREALYLSTRWSGEYAQKPRDLGTIEIGKYADMAILDRDYLTIPEDDINNIDVLATILGGKFIYTEPNYATAKGLPQAGFRGDTTIFVRGRPGDQNTGGGG